MQRTKDNSNTIADFSLIEMTEILIKHQKLHEGLYNLSLEFQLAFGTVGPSPELIFPGAMIGISRIGISKTEEKKANIHTVNAEEVNPAHKTRP